MPSARAGQRRSPSPRRWCRCSRRRRRASAVLDSCSSGCGSCSEPHDRWRRGTADLNTLPDRGAAALTRPRGRAALSFSSSGLFTIHFAVMANLDRRTFLTALGATAIAARSAWARSVKKVGMQLYTVRTDLGKDFDGTLAKVAAIGYKEVEFAGYFNHTPQEVRAALKRHG